MVLFEMSMLMFWKRRSKRGPGDLELGLGSGSYSSSALADDDVAAPHLPEDIGGGSAPEADNEEADSEDAPNDLEASRVTTNRPSSWRRGMLKKASKAFYQVISDMLRRNRTTDKTVSVHDHQEQEQEQEEPANEPATSGGFGIGKDELVRLVKDRKHEALNRYNGVHGLSTLLKTDLKVGIDRRDDEILQRRNTFGSNTYPCRKRKSFWCFIWRASRFPHFLVIMLVAVFFSLRKITTKGILDGWYVEACIILATFLDIIVRAIAEYKQSSRFEKLTEEKRNVSLEVFRDSRIFRVSNYDIVVGDIVPLKNGCQVPADGVLFVANSLNVDEQEITGSHEIVQKDLQRNPFLLSGSKVIEGTGTMLVTSVGTNTAWGLKMEVPQETDKEKPFQGYLKRLAISASWLVVLSASVACSVRLGRYFSGWTKKSDGTPMFIYGITTANEATEFVITSLNFGIATIVVAVPVGLSIAVRLNFAKTTKKMMTDKVLVQSLSAFERMGSVTTILCHQTGLLTLNQMSVADVWAGGIRKKDIDNGSQLPTLLNELIIEGIAQNTDGSVVYEMGVAEPEVYGSPIEQAILSFGNQLGMKFNDARSASIVRHTIPFNSKKKYGGVALQLGKRGHIHWKGYAKIILSSCIKYMDGANNSRAIDEQQREFFKGTIENMCKEGLRCAALAYQPCELGSLPTIKEPRNLVLLAIIGIKDPCRPGTRDAIKVCKSGSVKVHMVTDNDILTAQAIATECGILTDASGRNIMTGAQFRELSDLERKTEDILVLAESSPSDNLLFVQALKKSGDIVAATGMGIHDPETLREADISLAMGVGGTAAAKESSDIIILDDSFATVVKCIIWARLLYTNVQRSILFRLTVSVSALAICVVEVVVYDAFPLNAVQLLLLNLIIDILGALALAYKPRAENQLMGKPPVSIRDPLITKTMWIKLIIQVIYLVLSLVFINSEKLLMLKHGHTGNAEKVMNTFIFNSFVFCLVFNEFEIQSVDQTFNEILRENMFLVTITSTIISQIIVMELASIFISSVRLDLKKWVTTSLLWLLSQVATRFPYPYPANQYYRN